MNPGLADAAGLKSSTSPAPSAPAIVAVMRPAVFEPDKSPCAPRLTTGMMTPIRYVVSGEPSRGRRY